MWVQYMKKSLETTNREGTGDSEKSTLSACQRGICKTRPLESWVSIASRTTEDEELELRTPTYNWEFQRLYVEGCFLGTKSLPAKETYKRVCLFIRKNVSMTVCNHRPYLKQVWESETTLGCETSSIKCIKSNHVFLVP